MSSGRGILIIMVIEGSEQREEGVEERGGEEEGESEGKGKRGIGDEGSA